MPRGAKRDSNGKLVDSWYYEYEGIVPPPDPDADEDEQPDYGRKRFGKRKQTEAEVRPLKVKVDLYIYKQFKGETPPLATNEVWFEVVCETLGFRLKGSDIEALRAAMWEKLNDHYKVKWESYFLVEIRHHGPYTGLGTGLTFGRESVYKGTAYDGTLLLKHYRYGRGDIIEPWPGEFTSKESGEVVACIPDTKANREALDEFSKRIDILREKLVDLVRPETIMQTLLTLSSIRLLPMNDKKLAGADQE